MNQRFNQLACIVALVATLVVLGGCATQQRAALGRTWAAYVVPGATNVTVAASGQRAWRIRYRAPSAPATWYVTLARQLETRGWTSSDQVAYAPLNSDAPCFRPFLGWRSSRLGRLWTHMSTINGMYVSAFVMCWRSTPLKRIPTTYNLSASSGHRYLPISGPVPGR